MSGEIGIRGEFRVIAKNPVTGEIEHDTGPIKNTVTKAGVQMLLKAFCGGLEDGITGAVAGITKDSYVTEIGIGETDTALDTAQEWYDSTDCSTEMTFSETVSAPTYDTTIAMHSTWNDADGSYVRFKAAFTGFTAESLAWVALTAGTGGSDPLAGSNFTPFTPGAATVEVTYTVFLTQVVA